MLKWFPHRYSNFHCIVSCLSQNDFPLPYPVSDKFERVIVDLVLKVIETLMKAGKASNTTVAIVAVSCIGLGLGLQFHAMDYGHSKPFQGITDAR